MVDKSKGDWKIYGNVFDEFTLKVLEHIEGQGHYDELKSELEVGKEANVFIAYKDAKPIIVKIYRLENCNFNKMYLYLRDDPRYPSIKPRRREIVFAWVLREYRNLLIAREAGCNVPMPIINRSNVLIEEFIGNDKVAPKLKDVEFKDYAELENCSKDVINEMKILLRKAKMVHGDLSEFNILYNNKKPVLIDFSQATSSKDYHAREYLERDVRNVVRFFNKRGLDLKEADVMEEVLKKTAINEKP